MKCVICGKENKGLKGLSIHLKKKHKFDNNMLKEYYDNNLKKDNEGKCYFCNNDAIFFNLTKGYHKICNSKKCLGKTRATGTFEFLMYKYNLNEIDAKNMMNDRAKKRGVKIKESLDKELEKNKNYHKEKSHQTKEFWIKRGFTESESILKSKEVMDMIHEKTWKKRRKYPELYKDVNTTQIGYWLKKGFSEQESIEKIKERQKTFTLEICIEKYGEIEGLRIYNKRQKDWSENIEKKYRNGNFVKFRKENYSEIEMELFNLLIKRININENEVYFGENQFFRHFKNLGRTFAYDFVFKKERKIIEFNGDYWHCNPIKYNKNYFHKYLQMYAWEIWNKDNIKNNAIIQQKYDVLVIWEFDYKKDKEKIIQECVDFLKN